MSNNDTTAPYYDMVILEGHGGAVHGLPILAMSSELARDLCPTLGDDKPALAWLATQVMRGSVDTAGPGEPRGYLFEARMRTKRIWAERVGDGCTVFYPHER